MSIRDNVRAVKRKVLLEVMEDNKPFTREVQDKAVAGILKGLDSLEAEEYMKLFADLPSKPYQLERLMGRDGTGNNPGMQRARAYLFANGPCGTGTVLNFENGVTNELDIGLSDAPVDDSGGSSG
jgi:hypothetical protein